MEDKHKFLSMRGIRTLDEFRKNLGNVAGWLQKGSQFEATILEELRCYEELVKVCVCEEKKDLMIVRVSFDGKFLGKLKGVNVCIGDSKNNLYFQKYIGEQAK
jgi:hypothetical protein